MELIPSLPRDIGIECLIRVPYEHFFELALVCKEWKQELNTPEFLSFRKLTDHSQLLIALVEEAQLSLFEPTTGKQFRLPNTDWVTVYSRVICVGWELVVMGGRVIRHNVIASNLVHIYNFVSGAWRPGVYMPGEERMHFGFGSDYKRWIYVVGGQGVDGLMQSAMAYDVQEDKWINLPNMAFRRFCPTVVSQHGKITVIGGDHSANTSITTVEIFDMNTREWKDSKKISKELTLSFNSVYANDGNIYKFVDNYLQIRKDEKWCTVAELPSKLVVSIMTTLEKKILFVGFPHAKPEAVYEDSKLIVSGWAYWEDGVLYDWPNYENIVAYLFDLKTCLLRKVKVPAKYVKSCYCLDVCSV